MFLNDAYILSDSGAPKRRGALGDFPLPHSCDVPGVGARGLIVGFGSKLSDYDSIFTACHLQATLSKLLTCCVFRSTQPLTLNGVENK